MASGTLMKNAARHEKWSIKKPPRTGPSAAINADAPDQVPIALPRRCSSNAALMMARLPGTSNAAPTPCTARATISCRTPTANPHHADAAAKMTTPTRNTRRRPNRSPAAPPTNKRAARKSAYASTTHWTSVRLAESSRCSAGSATLTTVPSMNAMLDAMIVVARIHAPEGVVSARVAQSFRHREAFADAKHALDQQCQYRGRNGAGQQHCIIVECKSGDDALAITARADERRNRCGSNVDHGGRLDAGEDRRRAQWQLDFAEDSARRHAERSRRVFHPARDLRERRIGVAHDRQQRIEREGDEGRHDADAAGDRDQKREERKRRDRLHDARRAQNHAFASRMTCTEDPERNADDDAGHERHEHQ